MSYVEPTCEEWIHAIEFACKHAERTDIYYAFYINEPTWYLFNVYFDHGRKLVSLAYEVVKEYERLSES